LSGSDSEIIADAAILRSTMPAQKVKLIIDDRADLVDSVAFDGVHVDAGDSTPAQARTLLGPARIIGTFGGSESLVPGVLSEPVDYLSIGPVGATTTKQTTKPFIGVEGVRRLRIQAGPKAVLVAVGGVTLATAAEILNAGATTVAVAAAIFDSPEPANVFRRWMESLK
jgi:thiamine-phosphate pyrophosphorylase